MARDLPVGETLFFPCHTAAVAINGGTQSTLCVEERGPQLVSVSHSGADFPRSSEEEEDARFPLFEERPLTSVDEQTYKIMFGKTSRGLNYVPSYSLLGPATWLF